MDNQYSIQRKDFSDMLLLLLPHAASSTGGYGAPAWGMTPGCSFFASLSGAARASPPASLCLSALGVPYAGGELSHRGVGPTTSP